MSVQIISYARQLQIRFQHITEQVTELVETSSIKVFRNDPDSDFFFVMPTYYWGETDEKQKLLQMEILRAYTDWVQHFRLLMSGSSKEVQDQIEETHSFVMSWVQKESSYDIPATIEEAKKTFKLKTQVFSDLLNMLNAANKSSIIVVPDTNALIFAPDVGRYATEIGQSTYTVVIVPTVLAELDKLKIVHRDPDFRNKVESVIRRIKGLRSQGRLLAGVTVNKTVTVKMVASEPDFSRTLGWLVETNEDDRIIASVLEIQRQHPYGTVIVMTTDINLQNKAEMANIPFFEPIKQNTTSSTSP